MSTGASVVSGVPQSTNCPQSDPAFPFQGQYREPNQVRIPGKNKCSELQDERKEAESRTNVKLRRTQAAVVTLMEAGPRESMMIHQLYKTRVQMEIERSPDSTAKPS